MAENYEKLRSALRGAGPLAVAFSGGVDSSLLLAVAVEAMGSKVTALLARSQLLTAVELGQAADFARRLGVRLKYVDFTPLADLNFRKNTRQRCYFCKKRMYGTFRDLLPADICLVDGTNLDDLDANRPGLRAIRKFGVRTPLVECGFDKVMVRRLSRELGLATWNRFSGSCLATRIPFGRGITDERLEVVARAEDFLHGLGFAGCRVTLTAEGAVVSLVSGDAERFVSEESSSRVKIFFTKLNLPKVFLELSARQGIVA